MHRTITRLLSLAAGVAMFAAVVGLSGTAHATTILCGYMSSAVPVPAAAATGTTPAHPAGTAMIGVFYKIQTEDSGYKDICDKAEATIKTKLPALPAPATWGSQNRSPCSDFTNIFYSAHATGKNGAASGKAVCDSISNKNTVQAETDVFPAVPAGWTWKTALPANYIITTTFTKQ